MPDNWEDIHGLDPADPLDGPAYTLSQQYTNVEMYLNSLVASIMEAGLEGAESNLRSVDKSDDTPSYLWTEAGLLVPGAVSLELYTMGGLLLAKAQGSLLEISPTPGFFLLRVKDAAFREHSISLVK